MDNNFYEQKAAELHNAGVQSDYNRAVDDFYDALALSLVWIKEQYGDELYHKIGYNVWNVAKELKN